MICAHFTTILLLAAAALALCGRPANAAEPFLEKTDLFKAGEGGYVMYRIPGVTVTPKGTILVHCEGRQGKGDWTQQDILLRRCIDGGKTWTEPKVISKRPPNLQPNPAALKQKLTKADKVTAHNAVCIADRESGTIHMLYGIEYARFFHITSPDEGETWSEPVEITDVLAGYRKDYPWVVVGNGCGHGIQLTHGPYAVRMLVAFWFSVGTGGHAHRPSDLGILYSDDLGKTWQIGNWICRNGDATADGRKIVNPSETMLVQLSDGRVMASIRSESEPNRRLVAISEDGGATWGAPVFQEELPEPVCMASLIRLVDGGILFSNPDNLLVRGKPGQPGRNRDRRNVTVRLSRDDGKTWPIKRSIEDAFSGYSDLGVLPDGMLLCLYERGAAKSDHYSTEFLTLARFNLAWISAAGDRGERNDEPLHDELTIGGIKIRPASPPPGLVVREHLGLITAKVVDGQMVHRAAPGKDIYETRAAITPNGDFLLMFPEGGHYGSSKGRKVNDLMACRSSDKGRTWSKPQIAFSIDYNQHGFIPLIPRGTKRLYAFGTQPIPGKWNWEHGQAENAPIGFRHSDDDGHTWSDVKLIEPANDPGFKGMSVMRMCETDSGAWIIGSHEADWAKKPLQTRQYLLRSEDQGKTWTVAPGPRPGGWHVPKFGRMDEGRPINLGDGKVLAFFRTPEGHLWSARSEDDGKTWTAPSPTPLVHPDAPPMLFHLADGKTLVAFHHNRHAKSQYEGLTANMEGQKDRSELWVSTSTDEGRTWSEPRFVLANALAPKKKNAWYDHQCSYADLIVDGDDLHLFFPHRWERALHIRMKATYLPKLPTKEDMK